MPPTYSIIADDRNPALYTNRAMARLKLELWESAIADCNECLKLSDDRNMKAHYILSQAQEKLGDYEAAVQSALSAHKLCVETNDRSLTNITTQILTCKQKRWEEREKRRVREGQELEKETLTLMQRERDEMIRSCESDIDRRIVQEDWDHKMEVLRSTFEKSRSETEKKREVPDWAIDDISFCVMVDPVIVSALVILLTSHAQLANMKLRLRLENHMRGLPSWSIFEGIHRTH